MLRQLYSEILNFFSLTLRRALRAAHLCGLCVRSRLFRRALQHKPRRLRQLRVLHRNRYFRQSHRWPLRGPIENAIRHPLRPQRLMALLAQYPRNRVHHVRLPAPIRPHNASSPHPAERNHRPFAERLKPDDFDLSQLKQDVPFVPVAQPLLAVLLRAQTPCTIPTQVEPRFQP